MDQIELEKKQARDFAAQFGDKNYVFIEKKQLRPQVYFIEPGLLCGACIRRSCITPDRCIYAMLMALKMANTMPKKVPPWFEIKAIRGAWGGDRLYIEDRRLRN